MVSFFATGKKNTVNGVTTDLQFKKNETERDEGFALNSISAFFFAKLVLAITIYPRPLFTVTSLQLALRRKKTTKKKHRGFTQNNGKEGKKRGATNCAIFFLSRVTVAFFFRRRLR